MAVTDNDIPTPGDRVEGFRALPNSPFAEGFEGIVTEVHEPCPIPSVDEPVLLVNTGGEEVLVRLSSLTETVAEKYHDPPTLGTED
jgi:hypothetical protein